MRKHYFFYIFLCCNLFLACSSNDNEASGGPIDEDPQNPPTVMDVDGNIYKTIKIRNLLWMKENLKTSRYNDGQLIPLVENPLDWNKNNLTDAYCNYNNETSNNTAYGKLYNLKAVVTGKLCPEGWHIPTFDEWNESFGFHTNIIGDANYSQENPSGPLKEVNAWSANYFPTNSTKFTALPGGYREQNGTFTDIGNITRFWTSTTFNKTFEGFNYKVAWAFEIRNDIQYMRDFQHAERNAHYCRCIED